MWWDCAEFSKTFNMHVQAQNVLLIDSWNSHRNVLVTSKVWKSDIHLVSSKWTLTCGDILPAPRRWKSLCKVSFQMLRDSSRMGQMWMASRISTYIRDAVIRGAHTCNKLKTQPAEMKESLGSKTAVKVREAYINEANLCQRTHLTSAAS